MRRRVAVFGLLLCTACGGGPRSTAADLLAFHQPTPDPTLDAVVRDLPHALAGIPPTATPTVIVVVAPTPKPPVKAPSARTPTPAPRQKPKPPTPTPQHR